MESKSAQGLLWEAKQILGDERFQACMIMPVRDLHHSYSVAQQFNQQLADAIGYILVGRTMTLPEANIPGINALRGKAPLSWTPDDLNEWFRLWNTGQGNADDL